MIVQSLLDEPELDDSLPKGANGILSPLADNAKSRR